jgi:hypothetical protein
VPAIPDGILEASGVKPEQLSRRHRTCMRPKHRARMPAAREHLRAVQGHADPRSNFEAGDGAEQEITAVDVTQLLRTGQKRGDHDSGAVQRSARMKVVKLETLNESAVQQRRYGPARGLAPPDDCLVAASLDAQDPLDRGARPRQLRPDQGAGDAIENERLGALPNVPRNIAQRQACQPVAQPTGRTLAIGWRLA